MFLLFVWVNMKGNLERQSMQMYIANNLVVQINNYAKTGLLL